MARNNLIFIRHIGRGASGHVFLAFSRDLNSEVAVKAIFKTHSCNYAEHSIINNEKRFFLRQKFWNCPFLVDLIGLYDESKMTLFITEYFAEGDLFDYVRLHTLSSTDIKNISAKILLAIEFIHSQNFIFRDLKLENIFVKSKEIIKLADYGLCRQMEISPKRPMTFCGTPESMAPEVMCF